MRVAVLGLDCAPPRLVFEDFRSELPNLRRLLAGGAWGTLRSCHPPITVPAWACMASGRSAGELGIYGFRNRRDHGYDGYRLANAAALDAEMVWDHLGRRGGRSIVLGVPPSFPPRPLNGLRVGCFLTPSTDVPYTWPPELQPEIEEAAGGYVVDVEDFRTEEKEALLGRIHEKTRKQFAVARRLVSRHPWELFWMVEMGTDRIHHAFWSHMDPAHPKHVPGNPFADAIRAYYRDLDAELGRLLDLLPADTAVLVVSDHGARALEGGICFNEWLQRQGYLRLAEAPSRPTPISRVPIDWERTRAWGDGGYYGRLFLNVRGREPQGIVEPAEYEALRDELVAGIAEIADPSGRPIGSRALRPEELFPVCRGVAPDLIVYFGDLSWRSIGSVGYGSIHTFDNDTGPDDANHDWEGIFVLAGGNGRALPRGELTGLSLFDVAPTLLDLLDLETPAGLAGRSVLGRASG